MNWEASGCTPSGRRPGEGDTVARDKTGAPVHRYDDWMPYADMSGDVLDCCLYAGMGVGNITDVRSSCGSFLTAAKPVTCRPKPDLRL